MLRPKKTLQLEVGVVKIYKVKIAQVSGGHVSQGKRYPGIGPTLWVVPPMIITTAAHLRPNFQSICCAFFWQLLLRRERTAYLVKMKRNVLYSGPHQEQLGNEKVLSVRLQKKMFCDLGLGKDLLNMTSKAGSIKEIIK